MALPSRATTVAAGAALLLGLILGIALLRNAADLSVEDPRHERNDSPDTELRFPSVVRYLSNLPDLQGRPCFGLVLKSNEGYPEELLNLSALVPEVGSTFDEFVAHNGFRAARRWWERRNESGLPRELVERIDPSDLARRILPPVDLTLEQLEAEERFVIGAGFNYAAHRVETASKVDRFLFAKMVAPTGAYTPISLGPALVPIAEFAQLVDYEVEIGFVLLQDLELDALPTAAELPDMLAYVHANDVSNRRPIILRGDAGFTVAKSSPGYLPLGPWMVHGSEIDLATAEGGAEELLLSLRVDEPSGEAARSHRQHGSSREMLRGPRALLEMVAKIHQRSVRRDAGGIPRGVARSGPNGSLVLPRGSLLLTGTPHGTAIEAPRGMDAARLFLLGNLSRTRARFVFAAHCVRHRRAMGYLSPGDTVDGSITDLGRQRWRVRP